VLILLGQEQGGGGAVAVLVGGLGDDPDFDAFGNDVGAQEAGAVAQGRVIGGAVVGVEVAPIAGGVAAQV